MPATQSSLITSRWIVYLAIAFSCPVALGQADGSPKSSESPAEASSPESEAQRPTRNQRLVSKVWWNQAVKVEHLALTETQRSQMDKLLTTFLASRESDLERQKEAFEEFGSALAAGDSKRADEAGEAVKEAMVSPLGQQVDMMKNVVGLLTDEQRQKLDSSYPKLLSHMWIRSANPRSGMMGARGRSLGRRRSVN